MPEYLFRRTGGVVGTVNRLVTEAVLIAVDNSDDETGEERITIELLDGITADTTERRKDGPEVAAGAGRRS